MAPSKENSEDQLSSSIKTGQEDVLDSIRVRTPHPVPTSRSPIGESDAPKGAEYENRVVAFIDILGFREIIGRSKDDPELIHRIYSALDISNDSLALHFCADLKINREPLDFSDRFHTFSDCIVMSVLPDPIEIGLLYFMVFKVCRQLLQAGFLTRGGIACGPLLHRAPSGAGFANHEHAPMVFGPAFNEAYALESTHAGGSRIILQNSVFNLVKDHCSKNGGTRLSQFLIAHTKRSSDGAAYIDLFADFPGNTDFYGKDMKIHESIREIHQSLCTALNATMDRPAQFKKNALLAAQFNKAIKISQSVDKDLERYIIDGGVLPPRH